MGLVYEARDPNLDRRVAIKTIKVENLSEEAAAEYEVRFRTEARSAGRLQHPNIVSVYDSDRDIDVAYLVMEFIEGDDLKHHLDQGTLYTLAQTQAIMADLLAALDYAHRQNIVHRDIKPANLLIEASGRVKLTDFGVARIQDSGEATRTQGSIVGTLKYMSPEQLQGRPIDARADLFAAGVVLYQLLTGKRPFDDSTDFGIIQQIVGLNPPAPTSLNHRLPPALDGVVARAMAKSRDQRYVSAQEFAAALQAACQEAADNTVVPVASAGGRGTGTTWTATMQGGESLLATQSGTNTSSSLVTQEVELVYWKEIKDSSDPEDIRGFLAKFPAGIYADLARRRLKQFGVHTQPGINTNANASQRGHFKPDAATLPPITPLTAATTAAPAAQAFDKTMVERRRPEPTQPAESLDATILNQPLMDVFSATLTVPLAAAPGASEALSRPDATLVIGQAASASLHQAAAGSPVAPALADPPRPAPTNPPAKAAADADVPPAADRLAAKPVARSPRAAAPPSAAPLPKPVAPHKMGWLAGAAALVVVALGFAFWPGSRSAGPAAPVPEAPAYPAAGQAAAAPTAPASMASPIAAAPPAAVPAAPPVETVLPAATGAKAVPPAVVVLTEPAAAASAAARLVKAAAALEAKKAAREAVAAAKRDAAATTNGAASAYESAQPDRADKPAATARSSNPRQACEDRVLLGFQLCMQEQCSKPAYASHPVCAERRAMEQRRRDADYSR